MGVEPKNRGKTPKSSILIGFSNGFPLFSPSILGVIFLHFWVDTHMALAVVGSPPGNKGVVGS